MSTEEKPRLYTPRELWRGCGGGWFEVWFRETGDEPEHTHIEPCGWCYGYFILGDGSSGMVLNEDYNSRYGSRIWTAEPTDEQREAEPWDA